ncbi:uncharacterized protein LOC121386485 [Gigantopelta aegis]|uniref:uncharacterized protein LOC121386485 n=1 Tax=Gigantopelta aegis TaxID=1735272 RepID=UPI001B888219|nr:uncharacterized protein LOC121386485 [Gigantopelta aegis]
MKLSLASIMFVAFLTTIKPDLGEGVLTIDCMGPGIMGQEVTLKCYGNFKFGPWWVRKDGLEVSGCHDLARDWCFSISGYKGDNFAVKEDTLTIFSFRPMDVGEWTCKDGQHDRRGVTCWKKASKAEGDGSAHAPAMSDNAERVTGLSAGAISGIVVAVSLVGAASVGWIVYRSKNQRKQNEDEQMERTTTDIENVAENPGLIPN